MLIFKVKKNVGRSIIAFQQISVTRIFSMGFSRIRSFIAFAIQIFVRSAIITPFFLQ